MHGLAVVGAAVAAAVVICMLLLIAGASGTPDTPAAVYDRALTAASAVDTLGALLAAGGVPADQVAGLQDQRTAATRLACQSIDRIDPAAVDTRLMVFQVGHCTGGTAPTVRVQ